MFDGPADEAARSPDAGDLHYVRAGPRFNLGANVAPNDLGDPNELENSEDCRSAGGHGNQHVRLRDAQIGASRRSARLPQRSAARAVADGARLRTFKTKTSALKPASRLIAGDRSVTTCPRLQRRALQRSLIVSRLREAFQSLPLDVQAAKSAWQSPPDPGMRRSNSSPPLPAL